MHITLDKKAIIFRINHNSSTFSPVMHFVKNSFKNVKYLSNLTIISQDESELIRKRYLLKWAYKNKKNSTINFKDLLENLYLPIYIMCTDQKTEQKYVQKTLQITITHLNTNNELHIKCSEYNHTIVGAFAKLFNNSINFSSDKKSFRIKIKTKYDLAILKSILSRKKISGVSVVFITNNLNFSKLHSEEIVSEERAYELKLEKSYRVLGITKNSTTKEIKDSYKRMLRSFHPDKVSSKGDETIKLYTRRFQAIQEAYSLVSEHSKA